MKNFMFVLLMCLMVLSTSCRKEHHFIILKNLSDDDVYLCYVMNYDGKCALILEAVIEKNSVFEWRPFNFSIERNLRGGSVLELFFVNPNKFNELTGFYDCDSIPIKNDILRHYKLTLEDLRQMNFTITYP